MGKEFNWIGVVLLVLGSVLTLAGLSVIAVNATGRSKPTFLARYSLLGGTRVLLAGIALIATGVLLLVRPGRLGIFDESYDGP